MGKPWFRVKQYGVGAGLPCSWEGWLVTAAFLGVIFGCGLLAEHHPGLRIGLILVAVAVFVIVARPRRRTWSQRYGPVA